LVFRELVAPLVPVGAGFAGKEFQVGGGSAALKREPPAVQTGGLAFLRKIYKKRR